MYIRTLLAVLAVVLLAILALTKGPLRSYFNSDEEAYEEATARSDDDGRKSMLDERYDVREGGTLSVAVGDADVSLVTGSSDEVHVEIFVEGGGRGEAREYFERQRFTTRQEGGTVYVESDSDSDGDWHGNPDVTLVIHTPERFNLDVRTIDGDVQLDHIDGRLLLRTSDGDVAAGAVTGDQAEVHTSDGDIRIGAISSGSVEVQTSDGDILLEAISAENVNIRTSDGDILAQAISSRGEVSVQTSDGDIMADAVAGSSFVARTSDGDIHVGDLGAESSTLRVSDGSISIERAGGHLEATGGDADITIGLDRAVELRLQTSDGSIRLTAPSDLSADLRLHGDEVHVSSDFDFSGDVEDELAEGTLNGGGPLIDARATSGDVSLRSR